MGASLSFKKFQSVSFLFSFNGQEKDDEVKGEGNHIDFKFRGYDSRLGRFMSVDPLFKDYPWNSPYAFAENDVIRFVDLEGKEKGTLPGEETKWGYKVAIDNTRPKSFVDDYIQRYSKKPNNGTVSQHKPNYAESFRINALNYNPKDGLFVKAIKTVGNIVYSGLNDAMVIGTKVVGLEPRDLEGTGKNQLEVQQSGINTILNLVLPEIKAISNVDDAKKVYSYSEYVSVKFTEVEKEGITRQFKNSEYLKHNNTAVDMGRLESEATKTVDKVGKGTAVVKETGN